MKFKELNIRVSFRPKTIDIDATALDDDHYSFRGSTDQSDRDMLTEILAKIEIVYNSASRTLEQNTSTDGTKTLLPGPPIAP